MKKKKNRKIPDGDLRFILLVAALVLAAVVNIISMRIDISKKKRELEAVKEKCAAQEVINEELEKRLDEVGDEYIIRLAREELDFVFPGERVYKIRSGN